MANSKVHPTEPRGAKAKIEPDHQAEGKLDLVESPIWWFHCLTSAQDNGEFERAAESQRQLGRLGFDVTYKKPRTPRRRHASSARTGDER